MALRVARGRAAVDSGRMTNRTFLDGLYLEANIPIEMLRLA